MFNLIYNATTNTRSSPFYNYSTDELYVGDDGGTLWKIAGVFNGTPAKATGWTSGISIGSSHKLTGPVFDYNTHNIFTGDDNGGINYWRDTGSTAGTCSAPCFGSRVTTYFSSTTGVIDPPVFDGSTGKVHFFGISAGGSPQVVQTDATLNTISGTAVTATVGSGTTPLVHAGAFDNAYFTSPNGTGYLYVCGHPSPTTSPALYRIALTNGLMSGFNDGSSLPLGSTITAECSPLAEIYNSGQSTDWLFVGVPGTCASGGSTAGCVESINITSTSFPATIAAAGSSSGGTSAIVVDNVSTLGHASSLYYSTLAGANCTTATGASNNTGCAVQRTQSGLQ